MSVVNAADKTKTVADPNAEYESMKPLWDISRAICSGERYTKELDALIDVNSFTNLLIPFSPSMTQKQYNFYKAEAELPGIVAQYAKMLVGGLLRKQPILTLPDDAPEDAENWIMNNFAQDGSSLSAFLDKSLWEEIQTHSWIYVDYPAVDEKNMSKAEIQEYMPYPVLWKSETVINWHTASDVQGKELLRRVITRGMVESFDENEFHPDFIDTVHVHEIDDAGFYRIRTFERQDASNDVPVVLGGKYANPTKDGKLLFMHTDTIEDIQINGERLTFIPAYPLNGSIDLEEPVLMALIDKEIALYNKISRRNHLLYGAATYTPIISSDMSKEKFDEIVGAGLGSWIKLEQGDTADVLKTPTEALKDMESAIANAIMEMAKLGIRMLAPETGAQSGVALELRSAAQTAQLGTLNTRVSATIAAVIAFMLNWRYGTEYTPDDIDFQLSADFNPTPLGADWLRLATEWYQEGIIPRKIWIELLKQNDMIPSDYDDEEGVKEINADDLIPDKDADSSDLKNSLED